MKLRHLITNTLAQFISRIVSAGLAFVVTLVLANKLGAHYFGEYTKIITFLVFFYIASDFGINAVFLREVTKNTLQIKKSFPVFLGLRLFLSVILGMISLICLVLVSVNPGFTPLVRTGVLIGFFSIIANAVLVTSTAVFQAKLRYDKHALSLNFGSLITTCLVIIFLLVMQFKNDSGVIFAVIALVIGTLTSAFLSLVFVRPYVSTLVPQINEEKWKRLIRESFALGLVLIFNVVYFRVDMLILSYYRTSSEIGVYGYAYKFFEFAIAVPTFIMNSLYPVLLLERKNFTRFWKLVKTSFFSLFLISLVVSLVFWLAAPLIAIRHDFNNSIILLRILTLSFPIFYLTSPMMWFYIIIRKQKILSIIYGFAMVVNIGLNLLFIPKYGVYAAAYITFITETLVLLVSMTLFAGFLQKDKEVWKITV